MKNKLKTFTILCMALAFMTACFPGANEAPQKIQWYSLNDGLIVARKLDKKVLIYFWAQW